MPNIVKINRRIDYIYNAKFMNDESSLDTASRNSLFQVFQSNLFPEYFGCLGLYPGVHYFIEPIQPEV